MKIVIPVYSFGRSGGERVLAYLAKGLISLGHEVIFVAPADRAMPYYPTTAAVKKAKVLSRKIKIIGFLFKTYFLREAIKDVAPDIIIANHFTTAYLTSISPAKIKRYYYIQAYEVNFYDSIFAKSMALLSYYLPLKKIVNSSDLLPGSLGDDAPVAKPGVDIDLFSSTINFFERKRLTIGIIGRVEPTKGTRDSLMLLNDYCFSRGIKLLVNVAIHLPDLVGLNCIEIHHHEIDNDQDLAKFYQINRYFLALGLIEDGAFHYPCAEAMAAGCIVISNYSPLKDTGSQLSVPTFDKDIVFDRLDRAFSLSQDEVFSEISRNQKEIQHYSWDSVVKDFEVIIKKGV